MSANVRNDIQIAGKELAPVIGGADPDIDRMGSGTDISARAGHSYGDGTGLVGGISSKELVLVGMELGIGVRVVKNEFSKTCIRADCRLIYGKNRLDLRA